MKTYSIYTLNHPITNEIRYVGQTCQKLNDRLKKHKNPKYNTKSYKLNWVKSLLKEGLEPIIILINCNLSKVEADELERHYIKIYKENGVRLTNMTDGGEGTFGFKHSDKTKKLLSDIRKINNTQENKDKISIALKEKRKDLSEKDKLNEILIQPKRKTIYQYDLENNLIKTFNSLREIERELGYFRANISPCLKGDFKQAYGFIWKYN